MVSPILSFDHQVDTTETIVPLDAGAVSRTMRGWISS